MSEENFAEENGSLIDRMFGEEQENTLHSRTEKVDNADKASAPAPEAEELPEAFDPYSDGTDDDFADDSADNAADKDGKEDSSQAPAPADSAEKENSQVPEKSAADYEQEIANLNKRLHDTQRAYHERSEKASALEKRIAELENKKSSREEDGENWFDDSDNKAVEDLKQELSEIKKENAAFGEQQQEIQQQANLAAWHQAAASVREKHADFDELVYEKLEPMLDEENGDPRVRALYLQQADKTPEGAYKFARTLPLLLDLLDHPEGFESRVEAHKSNSVKIAQEPARTVEGKDAFRNLQSADFADESPRRSESLVDKFFG